MEIAIMEIATMEIATMETAMKRYKDNLEALYAVFGESVTHSSFEDNHYGLIDFINKKRLQREGEQVKCVRINGVKCQITFTEYTVDGKCIHFIDCIKIYLSSEETTEETTEEDLEEFDCGDIDLEGFCAFDRIVKFIKYSLGIHCEGKVYNLIFDTFIHTDDDYYEYGEDSDTEEEAKGAATSDEAKGAATSEEAKATDEEEPTLEYKNRPIEYEEVRFFLSNMHSYFIKRLLAERS